MKEKTRQRMTKQEKLISLANKLIPKTKAQLQRIANLAKYGPTPAQSTQIINSLKSDFDKMEQAFVTPPESPKAGQFNLVG